MTDHRDSLDIEDRKQVSHPVGVRRDRVVRPRLIRLPVAQQVDGNDRKPLREFGLHGRPGRGIVANPVDQQDHRAGAGDAEGAPITVDGAELE
jgi:hypothetical protein